MLLLLEDTLEGKGSCFYFDVFWSAHTKNTIVCIVYVYILQ